MLVARSVGGFSPFKLIVQIGLVAGAFLLWDSPIVQPLKLLVVLLHEMSHGIMALASGGTVESVVITPNEGGACHTTGGSAALIVSAGYLGSMFFGGIILSSSKSRGASAAAFTFLAFLLFAAALTVVDDPYSRRFALGVGVASMFLAAFAPGFVACFIVRFVGTVSTLYVLIDIYGDVLAPQAGTSGLQSDALAFAELTGASPTTVGAGWLIVSIFYLLIMLKSSLDDDETTEPPRERGPRPQTAPLPA